MVYDVPIKKRRILCSTEDRSRKFTSAAFCPENEKLLVTVSDGSEAMVTIWHWEKQKCVA